MVHSLSREELASVLADMGEPSFRPAQVWQWLYVSRVTDWQAMRNLPKPLRARLEHRFSLRPFITLDVEGRAGETRKLLLALRDGETIESALIPTATGQDGGKGAPKPRRTVCVSSQVGCGFRCAFCASGQDGLQRNLEAGEIVGQILAAADVFGDRPTHVVFMGIGEPLDNYGPMMKSIRIVNDSDGLRIGARRITVSTCGLVPGIDKLAEEGLQVELSVSLHAASNDLRTRLMPVNRRHPLDELLAACRRYAERTGRIVTFEYTLIRGVNDSLEQAVALADRLSGVASRINLIPLSAVEGFAAEASPPEAVRRFAGALTAAGMNTTVRASKGSALRAACGQLRASTRTPHPTSGGET